MTTFRVSLAVLLFTTLGHGQQLSNAEQEIRAIETVRLKNPNKTAAWAEHVAKGALFHQGVGIIVTREDFLAGADKGVFDDSLEMSDAKFSQFGEVAVFSYVFTRTLHDDAHHLRHRHLRRTVVYQHLDAGWQMITSAASLIPWADLESKPVDPKILDTYVGVWNDTPEPNTVTITRDGAKLMAQGSNEKEKTELLAISDDTFVVRGDPGLITFEKDSDGRVSRGVYHDSGGSVEASGRADGPRHK